MKCHRAPTARGPKPATPNLLDDPMAPRCCQHACLVDVTGVLP